MKQSGRWFWVLAGALVGVVGSFLYFGQVKPAYAANDRFEDYVMCTGPVAVTPKSITDGLWILDYRSGRLLGTVIDRTQGKILGWAEVDLTTEFGIPPRQNVHFLMTTGNIAFGQAALYLAETSTGKVGVYTMGPRADGQAGVGIRRHDMVLFRQPVQPAKAGG